MVRQGVQLLSQIGYLFPQSSGAPVVDHRVHMDDGLNVVFLLQLPLNVVNEIVHLQQIGIGRNLGMKKTS